MQSLQIVNLKSIYFFFSLRAVYHSLLWLSYALFMLIINYSGIEYLSITLTNILIHAAFLATLVYLNLYYFIPQFLSKKYFFSYFAVLLLATLCATPLELICLFWNMRGYEEARMYLIQNQFMHFIFMFLATSGSTVLKIAKEWLRQERVKKDLEHKNLQSELSFLKSQINPHFLFNTLNSLYALTLKKSDKAPEIVLRLSDMMRYMLYESNEKKVSLEKEVESITNYLELEKIRYGDKADINFEYSGDKADNYQIAPLLFIPFLENAFKHGLSNSLSNGFVNISMIVSEAELQFEIENSINKEARDDRYFKGGIGLANVKRRLDLIFGNKYSLKIEEQEKTYLVSLNISLL
jgi:two-component system, LytTR family, sensor kinase